MIEYRPFHNSDPPRLVRLWHDGDMGRGAAHYFPADAFDYFVLAQPFFDPFGLIVAVDGEEIVGFVHAGFAVNENLSGLSRDRGAVCMLLVHPDYRRQGIGRELVQRACDYLKKGGASEITLGMSPPCDGFYLGLYGGAGAPGLLESGVEASSFASAIGAQPTGRILVFQKEIDSGRDPVDAKLVQNRRRLQLQIASQPDAPSWWWTTRFGRLDSVEFQLTDRSGGDDPVARATVFGLDFFVHKWGRRGVGIADVFVPEEHRRRGYGKMLLLEIGRRLREELMNVAEIHVAADNEAGARFVEATGFEQIDQGHICRLNL